MKFRVALITALLALAGGSAQADTIKVGGKHSAGHTVIIRGAPARCDETRPLVINVRKALAGSHSSANRCELKTRVVPQQTTITITNIVVFNRHKRQIYIPHYDRLED